MTEQREAEKSKSDAPEALPAGNTKTWLAPVLTLLGSSGVISVFGPITGELYWEGYLAAYGLTPQEFPATPPEVTKFAYRAIVEGVASVFVRLWEYLPWIVLIVAMMAVLSAIFSSPGKAAWLKSTSSRARDTMISDDVRGIAIRAMVSLSFAMLSMLVLGYFALTVLVLMVSPGQARKFGFDEGLREVRAADQPASTTCDSVEATGFTLACPRLIAFSDKSFAVLDRQKVYRLPREGAKVVTSLPLAAGATASASK